MFTADKQHFQTYVYVINLLYFQRLTINCDKTKMAATENLQIYFGTKHVRT